MFLFCFEYFVSTEMYIRVTLNNEEVLLKEFLLKNGSFYYVYYGLDSASNVQYFCIVL